MKLQLTLALTALTLASAARAELPRVVVVLDETVDGKKATTTSAEVAVTSSLNKDGYRLVSGDMAEKLRKAQAVSMALSGSVPDVLSSLDADVVILGQVEMTKIGSIPDAGLVGYRAAAVAKLVRVDTAQIVDAISIEAKGNDFTEAGAAQKAAQHVGDELAKAIKASITANAKKAKEIDVVVHGIPDRAGVDAVKAALAKARGVSSVTVRQSGKGISKIELQTSSDAETLATDLEKGGAPLEIVQTSAASILARYDIKRGVKLGALLLAPTVKLAARGAWVQGVLPKLVAAELENVSWVDVVDSGGDVALALEASGAGSGDKSGDIALTITAQDPATKAKLYTASGTGKLEDLPGLVSQVVKKLDDGFLPAVARGHASSGGNSALARAAAAGKAKPAAVVAVDVPELKIDSLKLENLFPAKLGYYGEHPVGSIVVEHSDAKGAAATDVTVSIYVPRFMQLKSDVAVGTINPGEKKEIPLKVTLDNATVFSVEENTPTQAEVVVEYTVAGGKMQSRRVAPLIVYGKRAIDWSESASVTAFVTPSDENVRAFAHAALVDGDKTLPQPVNDAVALFQAMSQAQLRYVKDPTVPARTAILDTVQFPRETLNIKTGDCDDLSALYASLLESVGVETSFLLVPGHVLVGVATGLPPDGLDRLTLDAGKVLVKDGKVWLPVETTFLGKSFRDAWAEGARTVERANKAAGPDALVVVETRAGWSQYPPAALPKAVVAMSKPDPKSSGAQAEVAAVVGERDTAVKSKLDGFAAVIAKNPAAPEVNAYAAMLAKRGDIDKASSLLKAALTKLSATTPAAIEVSNNLANVDVLSGNSSGAVEKYRAILDKVGAKRGDVLTNLGIAYTLAGDQAHAVEAFDAALAAGASSAYIATGFERAPKTAPVSVQANANRADDATSTTVAEQELKSILAKALDARKKQAQDEQKAGQKPKPVEADRFANPLPSGARRGDDAQSKLRTAELLRWLS